MFKSLNINVMQRIGKCIHIYLKISFLSSSKVHRSVKMGISAYFQLGGRTRPVSQPLATRESPDS